MIFDAPRLSLKGLLPRPTTELEKQWLEGKPGTQAHGPTVVDT